MRSNRPKGRRAIASSICCVRSGFRTWRHSEGIFRLDIAIALWLVRNRVDCVRRGDSCLRSLVRNAVRIVAKVRKMVRKTAEVLAQILVAKEGVDPTATWWLL